MRIFSIARDYTRRNTGRIDGVHKWSLPGVSCPVCHSSWSGAGLEYPAADLRVLGEEPLYRTPRNEPLEVYLKLRKRIEDQFPELPLLKPGTLFGPIVGKTTGRLDGFVWQTSWTICLERKAMGMLNTSNLILPVSVKAELPHNAESADVFEFDLPLRGHLANGVYDGIQLDYCDECGRDSASLPDEINIDAASVPNEVDIFRVRNFATLILVTERFVETVKSLGIKGAVFDEVKLTS